MVLALLKPRDRVTVAPHVDRVLQREVLEDRERIGRARLEDRPRGKREDVVVGAGHNAPSLPWCRRSSRRHHLVVTRRASSSLQPQHEAPRAPAEPKHEDHDEDDALRRHTAPITPAGVTHNVVVKSCMRTLRPTAPGEAGTRPMRLHRPAPSVRYHRRRPRGRDEDVPDQDRHSDDGPSS